MKTIKASTMLIVFLMSNVCNIAGSDSQSSSASSESSFLKVTIESLIQGREILSSKQLGHGILEKYDEGVLVTKYTSGITWVVTDGYVYSFDVQGKYKDHWVRE